VAIWKDLEPRTRSASEDWVFAYILETPSERSDGQWYEALLFRDAGRTVFGKLEIVGANPSRRDFRAIATKVVTDSEYRASLMANDPNLIRLWRRH
jgi:hypothetical protein